MYDKKLIDKISIKDSCTLIEALTQMDSVERKLLMVFDEDSFLSLISIGDIQRAILAGKATTDTVKTTLRENVSVAYVDEDKDDVIDRMLKSRSEFMPVFSRNGELDSVIFWEDVFSKDRSIGTELQNIPIVVMAGGKGTRLQPLTNIIPKALVPIGDEPILTEIMNTFRVKGARKYFISVNYKREMIANYLNEQQYGDCEIELVAEDKPLGTAGSLHFLRDKIEGTFFVTNCDILLDQDMSYVLKYHRESENDITIVSALQHQKIQYGTLETGINGKLLGFKEKPEISYQINTGVYVLEAEVLRHVPDNKLFNMDELINAVMGEGGKVGVFPVSANSWRDIGQWEEYYATIIAYQNRKSGS